MKANGSASQTSLIDINLIWQMKNFDFIPSQFLIVAELLILFWFSHYYCDYEF